MLNSKNSDKIANYDRVEAKLCRTEDENDTANKNIRQTDILSE